MSSELLDRIASHKWYHSIDLGNGIVTPGYYDLRQVVGGFPWPDLKGKRCLDVGTFDGFLAFEMEKRGASEVVALDVEDYDSLDWLPRRQATGAKELAEQIGPERGKGFKIAKEVLGSKVERLPMNVYDLHPDKVGKFDLIICGSILTHLRDPIRALERIRGVCAERLLATEGADLWLSIRHPKRALFELKGAQDQWFVQNRAGLRKMLDVAGWRIETESKPFSLDYGRGAPGAQSMRGFLGQMRRAGWQRSSEALRRAALAKLLTGNRGPSHVAILARPDL
ncbi:MAG: class I SAM-dependent methyltransferase [Actinomycetota bacterium]